MKKFKVCAANSSAWCLVDAENETRAQEVAMELIDWEGIPPIVVGSAEELDLSLTVTMISQKIALGNFPAIINKMMKDTEYRDEGIGEWLAEPVRIKIKEVLKEYSLPCSLTALEGLLYDDEDFREVVDEIDTSARERVLFRVIQAVILAIVQDCL